MKWGASIQPGPSVLREHYAEPAGRRTEHLFNCDFALEFIDRFVTWPDSMGTAASILPNALGAEVFLTVEKSTLRPMALELIGGDAFTVNHYAGLIDGVEAAVQEAMESREGRQAGLSSHEMVELGSMRRAAFARLLVIGTDATFLYLPRDMTPVMRGKRLNLAQASDREIDCYVDGDQIVCFDGWVRTEVTPTKWTLVALPEDSA